MKEVKLCCERTGNWALVYNEEECFDLMLVSEAQAILSQNSLFKEELPKFLNSEQEIIEYYEKKCNTNRTLYSMFKQEFFGRQDVFFLFIEKTKEIHIAFRDSFTGINDLMKRFPEKKWVKNNLKNSYKIESDLVDVN